MPRVYLTRSARKSKFRRICVTCGAEVQVGESYQYAEPRTGPKLHWCYRHHPKRSQLSTSKLGPLWDAIDEFNPEAYETIEDLAAAVEGISTLATEVRDGYEDSLQNMPATEGPVAEAMQMNIDYLDQYISELEQVDFREYEKEDGRVETEIMVAREMLDEEGIDYEDSQLTDAIMRGQLIQEHLDFSAFEDEVNERAKDEDDEGIENARDQAKEVVESFEG